VIAAETRAELLAALATLRDDDREVLGARFFLDLSEIETAEALGLPRGTVKSRTSRALGRLRDALRAADASPVGTSPTADARRVGDDR
jgi:RNA polymerase sigma-70 factor (ECF subfamily)